MLLKYCLTIVFKERERERDEKMACQRGMNQKKEREKMACQRSMTQKKREKMVCQRSMTPANKIRHKKEHVFICALT